MLSGVAFVLKGYPRLSETFIAQEIHALEQLGLDILIVSLRQPTDTKRHPIHDEIKAPVLYLPEFLGSAPARILRAWRHARKRAGYRKARNLWLKDLQRGFNLPRVRSFFQSMVLVEETSGRVGRYHAHYLHTPASVSRYAAMILDVPWSCSAHARDIWTTPDWEKREKLASVDWLVTCSAYSRRHLARLAPDPKRIELVYHGLDFNRFPRPEPKTTNDIGSRDGEPVTILSVGRAVEKKGFGFLLGALARLPKHLNWRFIHIGYGPLILSLRRHADRLGIAHRVHWKGAQPHDDVIENYGKADIFVLANCVASDGDMDGLPNVIMEAQSQGVACISTTLSAIPELIEDGVTGLLVPPGEEEPLAAAIAQLITEPKLRAQLAEAGAKRVRKLFSHEKGVAQLAGKFGLSVKTARIDA